MSGCEDMVDVITAMIKIQEERSVVVSLVGERIQKHLNRHVLVRRSV